MVAEASKLILDPSENLDPLRIIEIFIKKIRKITLALWHYKQLDVLIPNYNNSGIMIGPNGERQKK